MIATWHIGVPWSPGLFHFPVKVLDPSSCSIRWDSSVGISRVVEHGDVVLLEHPVDPLRGLLLIMPVRTNWTTALLVCLDIFRNIECSSHVSLVDIGGNLITKDMGRESTWMVLDPWSVLSESVSLFESSLLTTNVDGSISLLVGRLEHLFA